MSARHAILGLLMQEPLHGYQIDAALETGLRQICHLTISQIYSSLNNMEAAGWVTRELVLQTSRPPKNVFHITPAGRAEMERWLRTPLDPQPPRRDALLTRIYFCYLLLPDLLPPLLEAQRLRLEEQLSALQLDLKQADGFARLMLLEASRRHLQASYEWLLWVQQHMDEPRGPLARNFLAS